MDHRGLRRDLRDQVLEPGVFLHQRARPRRGASPRPRRGTHRPQGAGRRGRAPRNRTATADPVLRHPEEPGGRAARGVPPGHRRVRLQGRLPRACTRSRSTSTVTWSRRSSSSDGPTTTAWRPAPNPSCSRSWRCSTTRKRSSSATATRTRSTSRPRSWPPSSAARSSSWSRSSRELELISATADRDRRPAAHRHPGQAGFQGLGTLGGLGRRPLQVRTFHPRGGRGDPLSARARHVVLLRAPALSPGQPDLRDPRREKRAARGGPLLRRVRQAGRAAEVFRRRRRAGRRLRRLPDQLRVVHELHPPGVRQRHRFRPAGDLRSGRRAPSDHRHRIGPRRGRAPLDAGDGRPGSQRVRRRSDTGVPAGGRRARGAQPARHLPGSVAQERA